MVHKWAKEIVAFVEGKEVQFRGRTEKDWVLFSYRKLAYFDNACYEFRIKPPQKKYRVALVQFSDKTTTTVTVDDDDEPGINAKFVRWLTDWVFYDEE